MDASLTPPRRPRGGRALRLLLEALAVTALAVVSLLAVWSHQRDDSPTSDEAIHLFSGAEALEDGFGWLNPEHPPLLKLAERSHCGRSACEPLCEITPCTSSPFGGYSQWLYGNRAPAHAIVAAGRRPFPWLLAALVVAMHLCVRPHAGPVAALLATGLVAFDPTFVAHAAYVHTDVGAALAFLLVTALCARAAAGTTLWRWLVLGLALGLALVTKFSTILLVPVVVAAGLRLPPSARGVRSPGTVPGRHATAPSAPSSPSASRRSSSRACTVRSCGACRPSSRRPRSVRTSRGAPRVRTRSSATRPSRGSPRRSGTTWPGPGGRAPERERARRELLPRRSLGAGFPSPPAVLLPKSTPAFLAILVCALPLGILRIRSGGPLPAASHALAVLVALRPFGRASRGRDALDVQHRSPPRPAGLDAPRLRGDRRLRPGPRRQARAPRGGGRRPRRFRRGFTPVRGPLAHRVLQRPRRGRRGRARVVLRLERRLGSGPLPAARLPAGARLGGDDDDRRLRGVATNYYSRTARLLDPEKSIAPGRYAVSHMMETLGTRFTREFEGEAAARQVDELLKALKARGRRIALVGGSITIWELPG
ncbi:MAG: glycosyltransferase family 39 protein [Holophagales bacterium]|nr:glycosyltransferase family 39 protein [Holophagales bacterium]